MAMETKYPHVKVKLSDEDGNAMAIIGRVGAALRRADVSHDERTKFAKEAMSGDYDHVIQTCMKWVEVS